MVRKRSKNQKFKRVPIKDKSEITGLSPSSKEPRGESDVKQNSTDIVTVETVSEDDRLYYQARQESVAYRLRLVC